MTTEPQFNEADESYDDRNIDDNNLLTIDEIYAMDVESLINSQDGN